MVGAVAAVVGVLASLLLEDAAVAAAAAVEFCCDEAGATTALPLANWLWLFWAVCRSAMAPGAV